MTVSKSAEVVRRLETWLASYMSMPSEFALVAALWAINTWIFQVFDACPYLVIAASTKQSGKTVLLELVTMLCREGRVLTDPTPATLFRMLEARRGWMTMALDEAEKFSREGNPMRPFMNAGYRKGQTLPRVIPGGKVVDFPVYCPKLFAQIGDVYDTLRDRSIVFWLSRGIPARKYRRSEAEREAIALVQAIEADIIKPIIGAGNIPIVEPTWLQGRDEEIWLPLISLAHALDLPKADIDRLVRASADLTARKTEKARKFQDLGENEDTAVDDSYAVRVLRDLVGVLREDERAIHSGIAVDRLKAVASGPWRTFKGAGLNEMSLAAMLARYAALQGQPKLIKLGGRAGVVARGYMAKDLRAAYQSTQAEAVAVAQ